VTSEDDFRRAIEANPDDWDTLAVFSDWLRDRDDPRADGYAALARHRKCPLVQTLTKMRKAELNGVWFAWLKVAHAVHSNHAGRATTTDLDALPPDWYDTVREFNQLPNWKPIAWASFRTRAEALDAAARGFAQLPAERRAELLTGPVGEVK
jgi:uncharacterized protein (TIGR02996 family)